MVKAMKTRLLKRLRRFAKCRVWIHYSNSEYEIWERDSDGSFTQAKDIDTLDEAKKVLQRYRRNWVYYTAKKLREEKFNKKLGKL